MIIATGLRKPKQNGNSGENLPKVKHYYDEPHPYAWQNILVIGAGNSGVDVALECFRANANEPWLYDMGKSKNLSNIAKPDIENRIKYDEIKAYFNTTVKEIREKEVVLDTPKGEVIIDNDFVLAMTGYHPNYTLMNALGIELTDDEKCMPIHKEDSLETNRKGIYVAGVVCGGMDTSRLFIENSRIHADQIAEHIARSIK